MKNLWAPWRMEYITSAKDSACVFCVPVKENSTEKTCSEKFCTEESLDDVERLIVHRKKHCYVMLNRYPYAAGHLLIMPYRHVMDITELEPEESQELMHLIQLACKVLRKECNAEGINVGVNLGEAAGAGIAGHLHFHAVPRWKGDSQFISVLDEIRIIPEHLIKTQEKFAIAFRELTH